MCDSAAIIYMMTAGYNLVQITISHPSGIAAAMTCSLSTNCMIHCSAEGALP